MMAEWPMTCSVEIRGLGRVLFCHASPRNDTDVFTRLTDETLLLSMFQDCESSLVVCGHTHMQFDRKVGQIRVVNAGSVGMPFGNPGAYWMLLGPEIEFRQTKFDLDIAAERVARTDFPNAAEYAQKHVLEPPTEARMLEAFSNVEYS